MDKSKILIGLQERMHSKEKFDVIRNEIESAEEGLNELLRIWVTDFPYTTEEDELLALFQQFGNVQSIAKVSNLLTGPFAFIDMKFTEAIKAIQSLDKQIFQGRVLTVKKSKQKIWKGQHIYALLSFEKKQCYVGLTEDPKRRFNKHFSPKGDITTFNWRSSLSTNMIPIVLEDVKGGYDACYYGVFLETVWRIVASQCRWEVINFPILSKVSPELVEAVENRMGRWGKFIEKVAP